MCCAIDVHGGITDECLGKQTLKESRVEWQDTNVTCLTYQEFAAKASSGRIDPDLWLYTQYNHSKVKVKNFGGTDDDKLVYTVNTWCCKSHGTGKKEGRCPAQVPLVNQCLVYFNYLRFNLYS